MKKAGVCIWLALTVLWIAVIFGFSSTPGEKSSDQSQAITEKVVQVVWKDYEMAEKVEPGSLDDVYDTIVRKTAHFCTYALLGILMLLTVKGFVKNFSALKAWKDSAYKLSVPLSVLVAILDEINQLLTEGRSGRVLDVLIDTAGIAVGTLICYKLAQRRMKKHGEKAKAGD